MKIQEIESITGITSKNIRFYEQEGFLHPTRNANGYREFGEEDIATLKKIKLFRQLHISLEAIKQMQNGSLTLDRVMQEQINELENNISDFSRAQKVCALIMEKEQGFAVIDTDQYLLAISTLEKQGVRFGDITKDIVKQNLLENILAFVGINIALIMMAIATGNFLTADGIYGKPNIVSAIFSSVIMVIWLALSYFAGYYKKYGIVTALITVALYPFIGIALYRILPLSILLLFIGNNLWMPIIRYLQNDKLIWAADSLVLMFTIMLYLLGKYIKSRKNHAEG